MECVLDLHAKMVNEREEDGFGSLGEDEKLVAVSEREIWLDDATNHQDDDDLLGMNMNDDASVFYADFPSLPDFPCMSSASCSSSSSWSTCVGSHANQANWMYWQSMAGGKAASLAPVVRDEQTQPPVERDRTNNQTQNSHQGRNASDKKQGWKPEKNLKFLLQKVLKQSDVGSLGRIVLPKKEAETHLPELEARDGISITMEDIGTSRVWNMRYRYWPNNKSRMYLLENTGDFVKANGLQEGDFIVLYSDVKCGKFMIRGVKVRQQGAKPEAKKTGKAQKNQQQQQHGNNNSNTAGNDAVDNNDTPSSPKRKK
uniref:ABI3-like factor n=1 Tax=Pisum sativum TaxID=3888 RepID=B4XEV7_PEA|nr:ABI3-like factor [Pisum sativum]